MFRKPVQTEAGHGAQGKNLASQRFGQGAGCLLTPGQIDLAADDQLRFASQHGAVLG